MVEAPDSVIRVGQDLVDEIIGRGDFQGARNIMETMLLPYVNKKQMIGRIVQVRSQYAVVLSYCDDCDAATSEMKNLRPYMNGLSDQQKSEIKKQQSIIKNNSTRSRISHSKPNKIGRNKPCFCGSGLKYKKCHGK